LPIHFGDDLVYRHLNVLLRTNTETAGQKFKIGQLIEIDAIRNGTTAPIKKASDGGVRVAIWEALSVGLAICLVSGCDIPTHNLDGAL
jgi:hypothetical protein